MGIIVLIYCNQICLENIALHKAAWQQNPFYHHKFNASLAVDGRKGNLSPWGGECVASSHNKTAEWRVDLESVLSIHHIVLQYTQQKTVWGIYFCFIVYLTYIEIVFNFSYIEICFNFSHFLFLQGIVCMLFSS